VQIGRPLQVRDYYSARGITRHYDEPVRSEGLRAILAVPIRSTTGVHGVIYSALRRPAAIGERVLDRAVAVARGIQHEIAVEAEVRRRLAKHTGRPEENGAGVVDQRLRDVHTELALIRTCTTGRARQLIDDLMHRLAESEDGPAATAAPSAPLSPREIDVITLAAAGHRNAAIGELLNLTEGTVKAYLFSATRKLGVRNRVEAAVAARRLGLIP
jgi:DNA-binding NarL/FixJ family response regulator